MVNSTIVALANMIVNEAKYRIHLGERFQDENAAIHAVVLDIKQVIMGIMEVNNGVEKE